MELNNLSNLISGIFILFMVGGIIYATFWVLDDQSDRYDACEDRNGEITSGHTNGCLIDNTLHQMTRTKDGWIVLEGEA